MSHKFSIISITLLILWFNFANCRKENDHDELLHDSQKFDTILTYLAKIEQKQDELAKNFANLKQEACKCPSLSSINRNITEESQPQAVEPSMRQVRETIPASKDKLSHMNKLSTSENSIPSSSSHWDDVVAELNNNSKQYLAIGHHYESMFGFALENLSNVLKDQLASFRLTLNKLMSYLVEHSYQYQYIQNKLSLIRDECSLAASLSLADRANESLQPLARGKQEQKSAESVATNTIRSSDIALIVRLLSSELSHLLNNTQPQPTKLTDQKNDCTGLANNETNSFLVGLFLNETRNLVKRLDQIDSIGKQSALLLSKMSGTSSEPNRVAVLDITNSNAPETQQPTSPAVKQQQPLRWFPGSRVPGKPASSERSGKQSSALPGQQTKRKCQSKTSSIRPTSCQELRQAGANCTGQYYIFLRGNIRHVYCDMNMDRLDDGGGWTVVLRRIDKSMGNLMPIEDDEPRQQTSSLGRQVNPLMEAFKASQLDFNLDWSNYRAGFGQLNDWAEFFVGLDMLHQLTSQSNHNNSSQPPEDKSELQLDLELSNGDRIHVKFDQFSINNEESKYELLVSGCNATDPAFCRPFAQLDGSKFYTRDNLTQPEVSSTLHSLARESLSNGAGWWIPSATSILPEYWLPLTMPIRAASNNNYTSHLYWPGYASEPLKRIIMKVRTKQIPPLASSSRVARS